MAAEEHLAYQLFVEQEKSKNIHGGDLPILYELTQEIWKHMGKEDKQEWIELAKEKKEEERRYRQSDDYKELKARKNARRNEKKVAERYQKLGQIRNKLAQTLPPKERTNLGKESKEQWSDRQRTFTGRENSHKPTREMAPIDRRSDIPSDPDQWSVSRSNKSVENTHAECAPDLGVFGRNIICMMDRSGSPSICFFSDEDSMSDSGPTFTETRAFILEKSVKTDSVRPKPDVLQDKVSPKTFKTQTPQQFPAKSVAGMQLPKPKADKQVPQPEPGSHVAVDEEDGWPRVGALGRGTKV